jgi:hypothetical protein
MARIPARIQAQIDAMEPRIREAFIAAVNDLTSSAQMALIVGHLERGDVRAAVDALGIDPAFFAPLDDALRAAYLTGGRDALLALPAIANPFPAAD